MDFMTETLRTQPWGGAVADILAHALAAVEPGAAVQRWLRRRDDGFVVGQDRFPLATDGKVYLVAIGKASIPMAAATLGIAGDRVAGGIVVTKTGTRGTDVFPATIQVIEGGHPIPDAGSVAAGAAVANLLATITERDLVIALISGGGSALLVSLPATIALVDLQSLTELLLGAGATIEELNTIRKHLDTLKGGGMARAARGATIMTLILSDVVGNPVASIASGPTVADPTTYADCVAILDRYGLTDRAPEAIVAYLRGGAAGEIPETPKPGDAALAGARVQIIADNDQAAEAAARRAQMHGFHPLILTTAIQGEAREVGRVLTAILRDTIAHERLVKTPACIIVGGETTVTLHGDGRGGRNQELALGAVRDLAGLAYVALIALATDGGDGPTDAAGAIVTGTTYDRARAAGLDIDLALARNDSYRYFNGIGDLFRPGPTQTNVNDLIFLFAW